jgi:shikimate dehydrogenase
MLQMKACGFEVKDGLGMLVEQAAEAFEVWRKIPQGSLDTTSVLQKLRASLSQN